MNYRDSCAHCLQLDPGQTEEYRGVDADNITIPNCMRACISVGDWTNNSAKPLFSGIILSNTTRSCLFGTDHRRPRASVHLSYLKRACHARRHFSRSKFQILAWATRLNVHSTRRHASERRICEVQSKSIHLSQTRQLTRCTHLSTSSIILTRR